MLLVVSAAAKDIFQRGLVFVNDQQKQHDCKMMVGDTHIIRVGKNKIAKITLSYTGDESC